MRDALAARGVGRVAVVLVMGLVAALLATLIPNQPSLALGLGALLLVVGFALAAPSLLLIAVFVATFAYWRVGPSSVDMSLGDAVTVLALFAAAPYVPWRSRALKRVLFALAFYLLLIAVPLLAYPTQRAIAEWFHRGILFGGALMIGAAVAHRRQTALALKAFVAAGAIVAVASIYTTVTTSLLPAYPFGMHKNAAGSLLAMGVILLIVAPSRLELRPSTIRLLRVLLFVGLVATQSRGAVLALVVVVAIYTMRQGRARRRASILFFVVGIALIIGSVVTLNDEFKTNPKFNAIDQRTGAFDIAINEVWRPHPLIGGGLRWFQENDSNNAGVHNEVIAELSEVGLIGLFGLIVLMSTTMGVLVRRRDPLGEAAFLVFAFLLLFGLTEILWVAGTFTLAMLIVGLAVGEEPDRSSRAPLVSRSTAEP